MANFYYVKSGGTATGDAGRVATTRSTGSFATKGAANYYDSIADALGATTPPTAGDQILCSHLHDKIYTTFSNDSYPNLLTIVSVDDTNCDQYLAGAKESVDNSTTTLDYNIHMAAVDGIAMFHGMHFSAEDEVVLGDNSNSVNCNFTMVDCTFTISAASSAGAVMFTNQSGSTYFIKDCTIAFNGAGHHIVMGYGGLTVFDNLTVTNTSNNSTLFDNCNTYGTECILKNSDLSSSVASGGSIIQGMVTGNNRLSILVENCKLWPSYVLTDEAVIIPNHKIVVSGSGVADEYYNLQMEENYQLVSHSLSTYLNADYDGTTKFSTRIQTADRIFPWYPYRYKLYTFGGVNLAAAKTVTVELTGGPFYDDNDVWIEVVSQDQTDQALGVRQTTQPADVLATGSDLVTTGTGTWTGGSTQDYKITLDIPAKSAATNSNVEVWVVVGLASQSIYFDMPTIKNT